MYSNGMMKRIYVQRWGLLGVGLAVVVAAGIGGWLWLSRPAAQNDEQIKTTLGCGRITADYRETDPLCGNLDLYRRLQDRGIKVPGTTTAKPETVALVIVTTKGEPMAGKEISVSRNGQIMCVQAPCPGATPLQWKGTADADGVVQVPAENLSGLVRVEVAGYMGEVMLAGGRSAYIVPVSPLSDDVGDK